jgi:branched-chain amino acid transport system ATP-binding protein
MTDKPGPDHACLAIEGLHGLYGDSHVLQGVSLDVAKGEVVTIIGRNGAGKTTTLRAIMGLLDKRSGSINVWGRQVIAEPPERIAKLGVAYVPEERGIYASLDVTENLLLPPALMLENALQSAVSFVGSLEKHRC